VEVLKYLRGCKEYLDGYVKYVGFVLEHDYSKATLAPSQLKGLDKRLFQMFFNSKYLKVKLLPVEIYANGKSNGSSSDDYRCKF
jgi:hypothetical protein